MDKKSKLQALKDSFDRCRETGIVRNQQEFADLVGVTRSTMSSAMNENERALTDSLVAKAMKIANELTSRVQSPDYTVPIVPYAVRGGALQGFSEGVEEWECERITSPIRGAELAFEVTGDSMSPAFPAGTRVLLKRVKSMIAWGEVHVIDTVDGPVLKRIDQTEDPDTFILRSDNPAYQPIRIGREDIRGVWRVLLRMIQ